jgi:hypothetical protein
VHSGDVQLDLGNRLGQLGELLPQRVAVGSRLRGAREQIRPAGVRIGHGRNLSTRQRVTGTPLNRGPFQESKASAIDSIASVKRNAPRL